MNDRFKHYSVVSNKDNKVVIKNDEGIYETLELKDDENKISISIFNDTDTDTDTDQKTASNKT